MDKDIDLEVIKTTQKTLRKFVKKPPLTEKLLLRPPFRFLHDIITTVAKTTGFYDGLFEKDELISENVKDKESKILFLTKAIAVLSLATGEDIDVKPSKIVAGQEVEKTNIFLQKLGRALNNNVSTKVAIQNYKQKNETTKDKKSKRSNTKDSNHSSEPKLVTSTSKVSLRLDSEVKEAKSKIKSREQSTERRNSKIELQPKPPATKRLSSRENSIGNRNSSNERGKHPVILNKKLEQKENVSKTKAPQIKKDHTDEQRRKSIRKKEAEIELLESAVKNLPDNLNDHDKEEDLTQEITSNEFFTENLNTTSDSKAEIVVPLVDKEIENDEESPPKDLRPTSATKESKKKRDRSPVRKKSPKTFKESKKYPSTVSLDLNSSREKKELKKSISNDEKVSLRNTASGRPPSARPGAPRVRSKLNDIVVEDGQTSNSKVQVIFEKKQGDIEDEETAIIMEPTSNDLLGLDDEEANSQPNSMHGHLVQQILDTKNEFNQPQGKKAEERDVSALKAWSERAEETRTAIRGVARSVAPLGRLLQLAGHHADTMRHERAMWAEKLKECTAQLSEHRMANEKLLIPLRSKFKQLEGEVQEKREKRDDLKAVIYRSSQRIEKLLDSGIVQ